MQLITLRRLCRYSRNWRGQSTRPLQFLAEGAGDVIVTQPRVVAARSVAERVREEVTLPNMVMISEDFVDTDGTSATTQK